MYSITVNVNVMHEEPLTKEDLHLFRLQLLDDIKKLLDSKLKAEEKPDWLKSAESKNRECSFMP